ncbi:T9SS type B sorting domain-containing protein [Robertkochia marina]|uniref:T9SS type B sorting domain-containing protein n=1 Tax=Robertkochia marina TaxID=1227945 RepID=A0A4V3UXZ6_9FLAO|nr:gliding motility-associated C-terminal domain-containing protein [Robertkochia marina]THD66664.1 T9SS type B sorting domain-containing protein [Robertkochia marina]TRZ45497.1 hypothetical protein D3A96_05800 [Robertkochia marina]
MKRLLLLPFIILVFSAVNGNAQDFTFDGNNCSPGYSSEWGIPDYADHDTDGDGFGEQDTPTGTADVLNLWYRANAQYLYLAFERRKSGNSYFSFYLNTDCDPATGDTANGGTDMAIAFDIRPGSDPMITNNLIYTWNGVDYQSTGRTFEAKVGMESCDGDLGKFFEFRIPMSEIFAVCDDTNSCDSISINLASALAGGSPNSKHKDDFDFPLSLGINSSPTAAIEADDTVCAGTTVVFDGSNSTYFDGGRYTAENAPDFMDSIVSYEWDMNYDGSEFTRDHTGMQPEMVFENTGETVIALQVTDAFGCIDLVTHLLKVESSPTALFDVTQDADCSLMINLDASESTPSSNTCSIISYEWDMNYDGSFDTTLTGEEAAYAYEECGTYTIALRVTDDSNLCNQAIYTQTVEVADEELPTFTVPENIELTDNQDSNDLSITGDVLDATDNCEVASVTFSDVSETDSCGNSTITRTWTATDLCGNSFSQDQIITISTSNGNYEITAPKDLTISCDANYIPCIEFENLSLNAQQGVIPHAGRTITVTAGSNKGVRTPMLFDSSVSSSADPDLGTPHEDFGGTGKGPAGAMGEANQNYIPRGNVLIVQQYGQNGPNDNNERGSFLELDLSEFGGVTLGSLSLLDLEAKQSNKRVELLDESANMIASVPIPDAGDNGAITMDLSAYNNVFKIIIVLDGSGAVTSLCFENQDTDWGVATVNDACTTPPGIWYQDKVSSGNCGPETITRTWYTTDYQGNLYSDTQTITIIDEEAPTFIGELPQDLTVSCAALPEIPSLEGIDNCDPDPAISFEEVVSGNDDQCGSEYTITRTWTVTDCSGNESSHQQTITVEDDLAPVFVEDLPLSTVTADCNTLPEAVTLTATDQCQGAVDVLFEEVITNTDDCGNASEITRTWTATDCAGNEVSHQQVITLEDHEAPVISDVPADVTVSCSTITDMSSAPSVSDNCDATVSLEMSEEMIPGTCEGSYTLIRTWTATDCSGNTAEASQTITVEDNEGPVLTSDLDENINTSCGNIPEVPQPEFTDGCGGQVEIAFETSDTFTTAGEDYEIIRTWTATDECGNETMVTQTIFVMMEVTNISLEPLSLCVDDTPVNLNSLLPQGVSKTGNWQVLSGSYTPNNDLFNPNEASLGNYTLEYSNNEDHCPVTYTVDIEVHDDCVVLPCTSVSDVVISKTITPNGDAYNEYFTVKGVNEDCGFRITVKIFNRWGLLVYSSNDYKNDWNGYTNSNAIGSSGQVPAGTYYYVVTLVDSGMDPFTGYIYVGTGSN